MMRHDGGLGNARNHAREDGGRSASVTLDVALTWSGGVGLVSDVGSPMDILAVLVGLTLLLVIATWSSVRSYFARGRIAGMEEAAREIIKGIRSHYEVAGEPLPDHVTKAIEAVRASARAGFSEKAILRCHERLRSFGDAVGAACWRKGYRSCRQKMLPREDKIRLDLPVADLAHLAALAHLGFSRMMPNDRGIEMPRFGDEQQAWDVARAIERLELSIPETVRPAGHSALRQAMIRRWWPLERKRA